MEDIIAQKNNLKDAIWIFILNTCSVFDAIFGSLQDKTKQM